MKAAFGVDVLVPEEHVGTTVEIIRTELEGGEPRGETDGPWVCASCGVDVDGVLDECWRCSGARDTAPIQTWDVPVQPVEANGKLDVIAAFSIGCRVVGGHPIVLAAALLWLAWETMRWTLGIPAPTFDTEAGLKPREHAHYFLAVDLLLWNVVHGLAVALAAGAIGRVSSAKAVSTFLRRLPAVLVMAAVETSLGVGILLWLPRPWAIAAVVALSYVGVRLSFWTAALVVDDVGLVDAVQSSWMMTSGNWWRTLGLALLFGLVSWPVQFVLELVHPTLTYLVEPVFAAIVVAAYVQLASAADPRATGNTLAPLAVPAV